ncbi:MAG: methyl-accepting chemotaxis protein [Thiotrichaceae bacterium]|nr:methyl-accepting chemotaxis protein [Thiotrichaceae bacterium]
MLKTYEQATKVNRKPVWITLVLLLVFIVLMILSFSYSYTQSSIDKKRLSLSAKLSLLSLRLYTSTMSTVKRNTGSFEQVKKQKRAFKVTFSALQLVENSHQFGIESDNLDKLGVTWSSYAVLLDQVLLYKDAVNKTHRYGEAVYDTLPAIQVAAEQVVLSLEQDNSDIGQLNLAISQLILLQKMQNSLLLMLEGRNDVEDVIKSFSSNISDLDTKLDTLMRGDRGTTKVVDNLDAIFYLEKIETQLGGLSEQIAALLDNATMLQQIYIAVADSESLGQKLFAETTAIQQQINGRDDRLQMISMWGYAFGGLSLLSLLILVYVLFADHRLRLRLSQEENNNNLSSIVHLRDRMTALSEGDLTVTAQVSNDITGSIADSFNHTVEALRRLVAQISITSNRLINNAQYASDTANDLSKATNDTSKELLKAAETINFIYENVSRVTQYAQNSAQVANSAVVITHKGRQQVLASQQLMSVLQQEANTMSETLQSLNQQMGEALTLSVLLGQIQQQVTELSVLAKNESYDTELLSLKSNVERALKASELVLPSLSQQSLNAVDVMGKMQLSIANGVDASKKSVKTLLSLEDESLRIVTLMSNIAKATDQHAQLSKQAKQKMLTMQDLTLEAFERVNEATALINSLNATASQLQESIYRFKLPSHVFYEGQEELLGDQEVRENEVEYYS